MSDNQPTDNDTSKDVPAKEKPKAKPRKRISGDCCACEKHRKSISGTIGFSHISKITTLPVICCKCVDHGMYRECELIFILKNDFSEGDRKIWTKELNKFGHILKHLLTKHEVFKIDGKKNVVLTYYKDNVVVDASEMMYNAEIVQYVLDQIRDHFGGQKSVIRVTVEISPHIQTVSFLNVIAGYKLLARKYAKELVKIEHDSYMSNESVDGYAEYDASTDSVMLNYTH